MEAAAPDNTPDTTPATMMVGRRAFVFGLQWESAANSASLESESVNSAEQSRASHIAFFRRHAQFGLGRLPMEGKGSGSLLNARRWNSAAAAIAGVVGGSTLAVFKLVDGRCVLIAIGPHGILPDGDAILPSVQDAWDRLEELRVGGSAWRRIYAPADWDIPDSRPDTLQSLLGRAKPAALSTVWSVKHRRRIQIGTIGGVALAAGLVVGLMRISTSLHDIATVAPPPPKVPVANWIPASAGLAVCTKAIKDAAGLAVIPGWTAVLACDPASGLRVEFARAPNAVVSILRQLVPGVVLSDDGSRATLTVPLTAILPHLAAQGGFASRADYVAHASELSQALGGPIALGPGQRPLLPGEQPSAVAPVVPWQLVSWTLATRSPPEAWARAIAALGAIQLDNLTYIPAASGWQLQGKIYARP